MNKSTGHDLVFAEYRIDPDYREHYLQFMREIARRHPDLEWFEGTDQPNLFVEVWRGMDRASYELWKELRLAEWQEEWSPLHTMIAGGKAKLHIWHFGQIR